MKKNFKETVQSMTAKQIIMAMVESLKNPSLKISMSTFGTYDEDENICYGCAATNTICRIANVVFTAESINNRAWALQTDQYFLNWFEAAIDNLRRGNISEYNNAAIQYGIAQITDGDLCDLPYLDDHYTSEDLRQYIKLAELQN